MSAARAAATQAAPADVLAQGLAALHITLPGPVQARLIEYLALLARWNAVHNLTAVREPQAMIGRHLLDSLVALPHLHGPGVLDAGTGAGLPGLPLALACPELAFTLVDSSRKRTAFVQHAAAQLRARNVRVVRADLATLTLPAAPATILARALAPLPELLGLLAPLAGPGTRLLAWQARFEDDARAAVAPPWRLAGVHAHPVPGVPGERCVVELAREAP